MGKVDPWCHFMLGFMFSWLCEYIEVRYKVIDATVVNCVICVWVEWVRGKVKVTLLDYDEVAKSFDLDSTPLHMILYVSIY